MTRTIRIDDEVFGALQSRATPFEDTPNDVLRHLLNLDGSQLKRRGTQGGRNVYVGRDGTRYSSRELVERFGLEVLGSDIFAKVMRDPQNWGLTHQADRIAKKKGLTKGKA